MPERPPRRPSSANRTAAQRQAKPAPRAAPRGSPADLQRRLGNAGTQAVMAERASAATTAVPWPAGRPPIQTKPPMPPERAMRAPVEPTPPLVEPVQRARERPTLRREPVASRPSDMYEREAEVTSAPRVDGNRFAAPASEPSAQLTQLSEESPPALEPATSLDFGTAEASPEPAESIGTAEAVAPGVAAESSEAVEPAGPTAPMEEAEPTPQAASPEVSEAGPPSAAGGEEGQEAEVPGEVAEPGAEVASGKAIGGLGEQDRATEPINEGEEGAAATEALEETEKGTEGADLLSSSKLPLAIDAQHYLAQIDDGAVESGAAIRTDAAAKREEIHATFAARRAAVSAFIVGNIQAVTAFVDVKLEAVSEWLFSKAAAFMGIVAAGVSSAVGVAATITEAIGRGIATLISLVVGSVGSIVSSIRSVARSISIPDIPGVGRIVQAVAGAVDRVVGAVESALQNVQSFITRAVSATIGMINGIIARVAAGVLNIANRLLLIVTRAVTYIGHQLALAKNWILDTARGAEAQTHALLDRMERASLHGMDRAERRALRDIEANRTLARRSVLQILEFCYASGDYAEDGATEESLNVVDNTNDTATFESAAREAMAAAAAQQQARNTEVVNVFAETSTSLVSIALGSAVETVEAVFSIISRVFQEIMVSLQRTIGEVFNSVDEIIARVTAGITGLIGLLAEKLRPIVDIIVGIVRAPVDPLIKLGRALISGVRSFISNAFSSLVRWITGTGGSGGGLNTGSLTSVFDAFSLARLKAAAGMASPPAIAIGAVGLAAAATAAIILKVLMWIAIIGIIIGVLILIYLLIIKPLLARARAKPRARPRAEPRAKPKARPRTRTRRRRKKKKPLWWNAGMTYGKVVASGGVPGTLDTRAKLPTSAPLHGHHPWPTYVGGPAVQPLMSVRDVVHISWLHTNSGLYGAMKVTAILMGYNITTRRTSVQNQDFIQHLRTNLIDRSAFSGTLTAYHAGLNTMCHPPIPAPAYATGILYSYPLI